jgi:hypothetical protein
MDFSWQKNLIIHPVNVEEADLRLQYIHFKWEGR